MNYVFISPNFPSNYKNFAIQLAKQGVRVLGLGSDEYDSLAPELKEVLTEYYRVDDMEDYDQLLRACGYFTFKYGKIDRIESHNEYWLHGDARLRSDFNVPGLKEHEMGIMKYKSQMKEVFIQAGIPVAAGRVILDLDQAKSFVDEFGYPVCVKPDNGVGAADTYKIKNNTELEEFFNNKIDADYIMEEFVEGEIHSFDGLVDSEGRVVFMNSFIFGNGIMETVNDNLDIFYYNQVEIPEDITDYGLRIIDAFKLKERFFHIEFFRTAEGGLVALEINIRPPGGLSMDIFNYSNDIDLYLSYAQIVNGMKVELEEKVPKCCCYIGIKEDEGIKHVNSIEDAVSKYGDLMIHNGPMASIFASALGSYAIVLMADDKDSLEEAIQFIMLRERVQL